VNVAFVMTESPIFATPFEGTLSPQPATAAAQSDAKSAAPAMRESIENTVLRAPKRGLKLHPGQGGDAW
jgi:hypothetical protein